MFISTTPKLRCPTPSCRATLVLKKGAECEGEDVRYGELECSSGTHSFPILNGVAVLTPNPGGYCRRFAHSILRFIDKSKIDGERLAVMEAETKSRPPLPMESDYSISGYVANQYLSGEKVERLFANTRSELVRKLLKDYSLDNPAVRLETYFASRNVQSGTMLDLGCSVGGSLSKLGRFATESLGVDISFASIFYARKILTESSVRLPLPGDRLQGFLSGEIAVDWEGPPPGKVDFVVGDVTCPPVTSGAWDNVLALGVLDIVQEPEALLRSLNLLLAEGGVLAHYSPYLWSEEGAAKLRALVPAEVDTSAKVAEWLYERTGFQIVERHDDVPWLFLKFDRRVEVTSVHVLIARRK